MTAAGSISMYTGPGADDVTEMFTGWRHSGIKDRYSCFTPDGVCVAKCKQADMFGKEYAVELAAGIDPVPIAMLISMIMPGGNNTGALAGAGVI